MEVQKHGSTLKLVGQFDGRFSGMVRDALYDHINETVDDVVVDLTDVESMDTTALKLLAAASHHMERTGRHLVLRGCTPSIRRVLTFSRLRSLFSVEREPAAV